MQANSKAHAFLLPIIFSTEKYVFSLFLKDNWEIEQSWRVDGECENKWATTTLPYDMTVQMANPPPQGFTKNTRNEVVTYLDLVSAAFH